MSRHSNHHELPVPSGEATKDGVFPPPGAESLARLRRRDSLAGSVLGQRYEVEQLLAEGGMGCVYTAYDRVEDELVALKVLRGAFARHPEVRRRFLHEARSTMAIDNPHVVRITDAGELGDGSAFYVMELLEGVSLDEHPVETLEELATIASQLCEGLAAAHDAGVVHRDLKPENILVSVQADGSLHVHLIDFGIAKLSSATQLTVPGQLLGTPAYIAPEQVKSGRAAEPRSDLYSLGVVLYELVAGALPFEDDDPIRLALAQLSAPPVPIRQRAPSCPLPLAALIMRCLEKNPQQRPESARAVAAELAAMELRGPLPSPHAGAIPFYEDPAFDGSRTLFVDHAALPISVSELLPRPRSKHLTPPGPEPWVGATPSARRVARLAHLRVCPLVVAIVTTFVLAAAAAALWVS